MTICEIRRKLSVTLLFFQQCCRQKNVKKYKNLFVLLQAFHRRDSVCFYHDLFECKAMTEGKSHKWLRKNVPANT